MRAVFNRPNDTLGDTLSRTVAVFIQDTHRHNLGLPVDPGHADTVVAGGGGDSGHVGAMTTLIIGNTIMIDKVIARYQATFKFGMAGVYARVNDRQDSGIGAAG